MSAERLLLCLEEDEEDFTKRQRSFCNKAHLDDGRVLRNLLENEEQYAPQPTSYFLSQKDLLPYMRSVVASWMHEVCYEQEREEEVFPLGMNYFDRVLSSIQVQVRRDQLQLIASTCMFIASKVREAYPITAEIIVRYTACSVELSDLLEWEMLVLQILKWDTSSIIAHDFLHVLAFHLPLDESKRSLMLRHAQTLVTMCIIDGNFSVHPPSLIACAGLLSSATGLPGQVEGQGHKLIQLLHRLTSIDADCIRSCCEQIEQMVSNQMVQTGTGNQCLKLTSSNTSTPSTPTDVRDISLCQ